MASNSPGPQGDRPFRGSSPVEPLALATLSELVGEPMLSDPPPPPKKPGRPSKASTAVVVGLCSVAMVAGAVNLAVSSTSQGAQADKQQTENQQSQNDQAGGQTVLPTRSATPSASMTSSPTVSPSEPTSGTGTSTTSPTTPATKPTTPGDATKPTDGPGGANPAKPVTKPVQKPVKPRPGGNKPGSTSKPRPVTKPKPVVKPQPTATKPVARPNPTTKPTDIARPEPTQDRPRPKPDNDRVLPDGADAVIRSFNDKRARQGIAPLKHDACLTTMVATPWAQYIASIQQPKLQNPPQSVNVCPGYFRGWEQVGVGRLDGDDFANLITNKSHNLGHVLSPQYTHIGIGRHYDGQGRSYWVLELAGPNGA